VNSVRWYAVRGYCGGAVTWMKTSFDIWFPGFTTRTITPPDPWTSTPFTISLDSGRVTFAVIVVEFIAVGLMSCPPTLI